MTTSPLPNSPLMCIAEILADRVMAAGFGAAVVTVMVCADMVYS
jgi:hypothetical protein